MPAEELHLQVPSRVQYSEQADDSQVPTDAGTDNAAAIDGAHVAMLLEGMHRLLEGQARMEELLGRQAAGRAVGSMRESRDSMFAPSERPERRASAEDQAGGLGLEHKTGERSLHASRLSSLLSEAGAHGSAQVQPKASFDFDPASSAVLGMDRFATSSRDKSPSGRMATDPNFGVSGRSLEVREGLQAMLDIGGMEGDRDNLSCSSDEGEEGPLGTSTATLAAGRPRCGGTRLLPLFGPASRARLFMDFASVVVVMYDVTSLPYFLAFDVVQAGAILYLSIISMLFWTTDLLFRFRSGFLRRDGTLEMSPSAIAKNYLSTTFSFDFGLICIDVSGMALTIWGDSQHKSMDAFMLWRIGKTMRLMRCLTFLRLGALPQRLERLSEASPVFQATGNVVIHVIKVTCVICWLNHIMACAWVSMGRLGPTDTSLTWLDAPIGYEDFSGTYADSGQLYQYTTALHWAITQISPGSMQVFPLNSAERVYNSFCLIFGLLVFSLLISSISATVTEFKIAMQSNNAKMQTLNRYLRRVQISSEVAMQVRTAVLEKLRYRKPLSDKDVEVLRVLPVSMQSTLRMEVCGPLLRQHVYFNFWLDVDCLTLEEACHSCADVLLISKMDSLFLASTEGQGMYFVMNGELKYSHRGNGRKNTLSRTTMSMTAMMLSAASEKYITVAKGEWLSEAALWCNWWHVGNAECLNGETCEALKIQADKLIHLLSKQSDISTRMAGAYAISFCRILTASCANDRKKWPTDLRAPFSVEEVMAAMPKQARDLVGHIATRFIKKQRRSRGYFSSPWAALSEDRFAELCRQVDAGTRTLMLTHGTKHGVQSVVLRVVVELSREDGRQLAVLKRPRPHPGEELASTEMPSGRREDEELPKQCLQRVLEELFGPEAAGKVEMVSMGPEPTVEVRDQDRFGIPTCSITSVFSAQWPQEDAERSDRAVGGRTSRVSSLASTDPLDELNLVWLASGGVGAWLSKEEIDRFGTAAGRSELTERMKKIPRRSSPGYPSTSSLGSQKSSGQDIADV